jgi:hypothetical protein
MALKSNHTTSALLRRTGIRRPSISIVPPFWPASPAISQLLRSLLDSDQTLVRIEAYKVLANRQDPAIHSLLVRGENPNG